MPEVRQAETQQKKTNAEKIMDEFKMQLPLYIGEGREVSPYEYLEEITEFCE